MQRFFALRATLPFITALSLAGCAKETQEVAQDLGLLSTTCGSDGARLQATINGDAYCANAQVIAIGDGSSIMITGVNLAGGTVVLQVDTLAVGVHSITEANNSLMHMDMGVTYVPSMEAGTLTVTLLDTVAHRLQAQFSATLSSALNNDLYTMSGDVDVTYTVQ